MRSKQALDHLRRAAEKDPNIVTPREDIEKSLGSDPRTLSDLGITGGDLLRLQRLGLAVKARYATSNNKRPEVTGPHRTRWIIFKEALG